MVIVEKDTHKNWTAIAPFVLKRNLLGQKCLEFIGAGQACTDYSDLITSDKNHRPFAKKLGNFILEFNRTADPGGQIVAFELDGVQSNTTRHANLTTCLEQSGFSMTEKQIENCWEAKLSDSWEVQNSQFSKKHRRKTKKAIQKLKSDTFSLCTSNDDNFDSLWDNFVHLHQLRRGMMQQPGCFASRKFEQFLRRATSTLSGRNAAELIEIRMGDKPVASALLFENDKTTFMYQTGFDPQHRCLEPGYLLIVASMQRAIEKGKSAFDFLRGDEPYKARWNTVPKPLVRLRLTRHETMLDHFISQSWLVERKTMSLLGRITDSLPTR